MTETALPSDGARRPLLHLLTIPADDEIVAHIEKSDPLFTSRVLKPAELADFLGITPSALANFRSRGEGGPPFIEVKGSVRYLMADVIVWLRQHRKFRSAA